MKTFLILLLVSACGVAGYEFFQHQQQAAAYIDARSQYAPSIAKLKKENQDLVTEQTQLTTKLTTLQNQDADLKAQATSTTDSATPPPPAVPGPAPGNAPPPAHP